MNDFASAPCEGSRNTRYSCKWRIDGVAHAKRCSLPWPRMEHRARSEKSPITDFSPAAGTAEAVLYEPGDFSADPSYSIYGLDCEPWCRNREVGSCVGCRRFWPPTWLAIRGSCTMTKRLRTPNWPRF